MKKINFKALLVIVMVFVVLFAFAACKPKDSPSPSPTNTVDPGPDIAAYLVEVLEGVDVTIDNLSSLTNRFDVDVEFYAEVNEDVYIVSIKANIDINADADNEDNNFAFEVTKGEDLVIGLYYNGADEAIFLNYPDKGIKRYIDGFDFLATLYDFVDAQEDSFASMIPAFSLAGNESVADILDLVAGIAFTDVIVTEKAGGVTKYEFIVDSELISAFLPMLLEMLEGMASDIEGAIDDIFGTDGFKLTEFTIPSFDLSLVAEVSATKGLTELGIDFFLPEFTFKVNNEDTGKLVEAFSLKAGVKLNLGAAGTDFAVNVPVPTILGADYDYFSPLNVQTSGTFTLAGEVGSGVATFVIVTDINPFKLTEAEAYILIETGADALSLSKLFELNVIGGNAYVDVLVDGVWKNYTLNLQEGIDLVMDVIDGLDTLVFPEGEEDTTPVEGEGLDIMKLVGVLTSISIEEDVLTIDKAFVEDLLEAIAMEFDLPEDFEFTAVLLKDNEGKVYGTRATFYMKTVDDEDADVLTYTEITYYGIITVQGDVFTAEFGEIVEDEDVKSADVVFTINKDGSTIDGFTLLVKTYGDVEKTIVDLALTEFAFSWSEAYTVPAEVPADTSAYVDVLADFTAADALAEIQALIDKYFGPEVPQEDPQDID